ncbi:MAG: hypothetical protein OXM61_07275 [Candidatus Poribacteria bacterium]|nr:hypothetical protein [Candidatus Poribacteria bacterium]
MGERIRFRYAAVKIWNDRRIEAEDKGEDFDEPMPTPQNVQEATPIEQTTSDHAVDGTNTE